MSKGEPINNPEELGRIAKVLDSAEVQRRLGELEGSVRELGKQSQERHARFITIVFSCMTAFVAVCAILVTALGWLSRSETGQATRDMKSEVTAAISKMDSQFEKLAGESLKKPILQILTQDRTLDGRVFEFTNRPPLIQLGSIFLKNVGTRRTDTLSVRLYASDDLRVLSPNAMWEAVTSNDRDYRFSWYRYGAAVNIDATETWTLENVFRFEPESVSTNINLKLAVFYGAENPAEADFSVRFK